MTRFTNKTARFAFARETKEELTTLKRMIEDEKVGSIVDRVYALEQAAEAQPEGWSLMLAKPPLRLSFARRTKIWPH